MLRRVCNFLEKVKDEKFNRLKDVYVKLRNDHIQKLREKAEVDKKLAQTMKRLEDLEQSKADLDSTIVQLRGQVSKVEERFQKSSCEQNDELEALKRDKELFNMETEVSGEDDARAGFNFSVLDFEEEH